MDPLDAFAVLDLRVGRVLRAEPNEAARKPAFKLWIDFGPLGVKPSSAQLTTLYTPDVLVGRLGYPPETVQQTSDRHWTWTAVPK